MNPQGYCMEWQKPLIFASVIGDVLIVLAYVAIPLIMLQIRKEFASFLARMGILLMAMLMFSVSVLHILDIVTIWFPLYWVETWFKMLTGYLSVLTALAGIPVIREMRNNNS